MLIHLHWFGNNPEFVWCTTFLLLPESLPIHVHWLLNVVGYSIIRLYWVCNRITPATIAITKDNTGISSQWYLSKALKGSQKQSLLFMSWKQLWIAYNMYGEFFLFTVYHQSYFFHITIIHIQCELLLFWIYSNFSYYFSLAGFNRAVFWDKICKD